MMEIVRVENSDLLEIEGDRYRTFRAVSEPLTADVILNDIQIRQRRRVIVICNTVSQSQGLFKDLKELNQDGKLKITLLHSRFLPQDRAAKEKYLEEQFEQNWQDKDDGRCHVLISTQVIEAGINITCEVMHTHLSPMNSLVQRAGRCARFREKLGEVYVYYLFHVNKTNSGLAEKDSDFEPEAASKNKQKFLPYNDEICELTWQVLQEHTGSDKVNQHVGFRKEETWLNQVHQQENLLQAQLRQNNKMNFEEKFKSAVFSGCRSAANELIRSIDNRSVFVWEEPTLIDLDNERIDPKELTPFSIPIYTLCSAWRQYTNLEYKIDWLFKSIQEPSDRMKETYSLPICKLIESRAELVSSVRILVNPKYVSYDAEVGLLISVEDPGNQFSSPIKQKKLKSEYKYLMDTYVGHLGCMWTCWRKPFPTERLKNGVLTRITYSSVRDELLQPGGRFIKARIFLHTIEAEAEALFEYLVFFAVLIHDLGKLQVKWQEVVRGWQAIAHQQFKCKNPQLHLLAHTDSDPENAPQQKARREYEKKNRRPPHAVESAFMGRDILKQSLIPLLQEHFDADGEQSGYIAHAVVMAAARHHSAWAKGDDLPAKIELHPQAQAVISRSWDSLARFLPQIPPLAKANLKKRVYSAQPLTLGDVFESDQTEYLHLYLLVVRALRLCDQRSVQLERIKSYPS